jgi:hypothetical protein
MSEQFESGLMRLRELATPSGAPSCAQSQFGGDVIAELSRTYLLAAGDEGFLILGR